MSSCCSWLSKETCQGEERGIWHLNLNYLVRGVGLEMHGRVNLSRCLSWPRDKAWQGEERGITAKVIYFANSVRWLNLLELNPRKNWFAKTRILANT